ncbi:MAG: hypothetical protein PHI47_10475 [Sulfuricurvum sp.]|uniref:AbiU2 domain-containing protein n=1 Tax=Sulfuricurvum sp. TaxID=2025608 RepID=UPI00260EE6CD|nr:hypothetical protein [Sulfuricurvum sp.]MDD5160466.1 hypothetical protein [Sulfuricurvum sp.]
MNEETIDFTEIADSIYKMLYIVADLRRDLEIYRGLFDSKENEQILKNNFREIEATIRVSISTRLILGVAALFVDGRKSCGDENLSFKALLNRSENNLSDSTRKIWENIEKIIEQMKIKDFRNKRLAHFDYDVLMGKKMIEATIPNDKLDEALQLAQDLLHQISFDIGYLDGSKSYFYTPILKEHSPKEFLMRISKKIN